MSTETPEIRAGARVRLINPGGYNNYCGTVRRVRYLHGNAWARIDWDMHMRDITSNYLELNRLEYIGDRRE